MKRVFNTCSGEHDPVEQALCGPAPHDQAPASLHASIMQAVRASRETALPVTRRRVGLWATAPVAVAVVLLCVWFAGDSRRDNSKASLSAAVAALQLGQEAPHNAAAAALRPLNDELGRIGRDLDSTAQFLLASIP